MAFWQLTVASSPETTDGLTNFLWEQGALGVVEEETPPDPARLRAFFPETASSTALMTAVRAYCASLRSLGLSGAAAEPDISPLLDAAWASAWQQSFPARAIGERLLVRPPWEADLAANGRLVLVIEPGRAFGTGHHGSTEGCLVLLERALAGSRGGARARHRHGERHPRGGRGQARRHHACSGSTSIPMPRPPLRPMPSGMAARTASRSPSPARRRSPARPSRWRWRTSSPTRTWRWRRSTRASSRPAAPSCSGASSPRRTRR